GIMDASCQAYAEPVAHPLAPAAHVARKAPAVLLRKARHRGVAEREVPPSLVGVACEVARPRPAAVVAKRRVSDEASTPALEDSEREVAVVTVIEAVALVEAPDRVQELARQAHAHRVDERHVLPRGPDGRPRREAVDDRAPHHPPVGPQPLGAVKAGPPRAPLGP